MIRLPVTKTAKVYLGGAFVRSESGRVQPWRDGGGNVRGHVPLCTRKDLRQAVESAARAAGGWAQRPPCNRGQILYRLAEMLEGRSAELASALVAGGTARPRSAAQEVASACDRLVYYAGWADKFQQVLGSTNAVTSPHFNFTLCEPMGVVGVVAGEACPLLGLLSQIAPIIAGGNAVVALAAEHHPYPVVLLGEILAVADVPGGVVNLLTGRRAELLPTFATHAHLRGLDVVVNDDGERTRLGTGAAETVKRIKLRDATATDWTAADAHENVYAIRDFVEFKTTWHPIGG